MSDRGTLIVRVNKKWLEAENICAYELVDVGGESLPTFTAGSHIDLHLGEGFVRQYSLCNDPSEKNRYVIAVLKDPQSRGGSIRMHEEVHVGDLLTISTPKNYFVLSEDVLSGKKKAILVAGGIGVTPLLSMLKYLNRLNIECDFYYYGRSRNRMAFISYLNNLDKGLVAILCDDEESLSLNELLSKYSNRETVIYTCGPAGFLDAICAEAVSQGWIEDNICFERFAPSKTINSNSSNSFKIQLIKSGCQLDVPEDKTILDVLIENQIEIESSCEQGICGTCMVDVVEGIPEHHDYYLSDKEKEENKKILICCSRSKTDVLVLDL